MFSYFSLNLKLAIYYECQASYRLATWLTIRYISKPLTQGPVRGLLKFHVNYVQKIHFISYFMHFFKEFLKDRAAQFALTEAVSIAPYHIMLILMCNLVLK